MTSYIDRLRTAPLADLEATATRAVRNAVAAAHAAGRSTVGQDASGRLVRTFPDGREVTLEPKRHAAPEPSRHLANALGLRKVLSKEPTKSAPEHKRKGLAR
jgi:hypothetical protein